MVVAAVEHPQPEGVAQVAHPWLLELGAVGDGPDQLDAAAAAGRARTRATAASETSGTLLTRAPTTRAYSPAR